MSGSIVPQAERYKEPYRLARARRRLRTG